MALDLSRHPCFNEGGCADFGRIHLPVAPKCNVQCRFCNRKYDCVNESRPGVTSSILSPGQAVEYLDRALKKVPSISVVGIAGPGEPFANPEATLETLSRVRDRWSDMLLCVSSNGMNLAQYAGQLAELEVSHATVTVCGVEEDIVNQIYSWVRPGKKVYRGGDIGPVVLERQLDAIKAIKEYDILLKVNCIVIPGVNDHHVLDVARQCRALGADIFNAMPLCLAPGSDMENHPLPDDDMIYALRDEAENILPQMRHCRRCRADAVGLLDEDKSLEMASVMAELANGPIEPNQERPYVAVASQEGFLVNLHLGQAEEFMIFKRLGEEGFKLVETRKAPRPGGGDERWLALADVLHDCRGVLASGAGMTPRMILKNKGLKVYSMEGLIELGLVAVFNGKENKGSSCSDTSCSACPAAGICGG